MGIGIPGEECKSVGGALVNRYLKRVVIGKVEIPSGDDLREVRELAEVRLGSSLISRYRVVDRGVLLFGSADAALSKAGAGACGAIGSRTNASGQRRTWIKPAGPDRWLVDVGFASEVKPVVTNVSDVYR